MDGMPKQVETPEEQLRIWRANHLCWVTKAVIRSHLLRCSCGFSQPVDGPEAAYKAVAAHMQATMPQMHFPGSQVGHWLFHSSLTKSKKHHSWTCRCIICGFKVQCVDFTGMLLPLTGSQYRKRRAHDKEKHPGNLVEQKDAEDAMLAR
jgi:hypothetical protein